MLTLLRLRTLASAGLVLALAACAHPIVIGPAPSAIQATAPVNKIDKQIVYVIAPADRELEVTTPGGGGDSIKYHPYRDLELTFHSVLSDVFSKVTQVTSIENAKTVGGVDYVVVPKVTTTSSSSSILTWPPTDFSITIATSALNSSGTEVWSGSVTGKGHAEFDDFKHDFALAAHRAAEDVAGKLREQLVQANSLRRGVPMGPSSDAAVISGAGRPAAQSFVPVISSISPAAPPAKTAETVSPAPASPVVLAAPVEPVPVVVSTPVKPVPLAPSVPEQAPEFQPAQVVTSSSAASTPPMATVELAASAEPADNVIRKLGTWSYEVEQLALQQRCEGDGAWIIAKNGNDETYRVDCHSGARFTAVCSSAECHAS